MCAVLASIDLVRAGCCADARFALVDSFLRQPKTFFVFADLKLLFDSQTAFDLHTNSRFHVLARALSEALAQLVEHLLFRHWALLARCSQHVNNRCDYAGALDTELSSVRMMSDLALAVILFSVLCSRLHVRLGADARFRALGALALALVALAVALARCAASSASHRERLERL